MFSNISKKITFMISFKSDIPDCGYYRNQKEEVNEIVGHFEIQKIDRNSQDHDDYKSVEDMPILLFGRLVFQKSPTVGVCVHDQEQ